MTKNYDTFICDLGVAKLQALGTVKTSTVYGAGTVPYQAPEMFLNSKRRTAVDIYAFGCVMVELFTGRRVWEGLTNIQITAKILGSFSVPPQSPSCDDVPDQVKEICSQCVNLEPTVRPSAMSLLKLFRSLSFPSRDSQ